MSLFLVVLALAAQDPEPPAPSEPPPAEAPVEVAPAEAPAEVAPADAPASTASTAPTASAAQAEAPQAPVDESERARMAGWTVAGASAAGFVGGALFAVPAMLSLPFGPLIGIGIGVPVLAFAAAFGGFVAELGYARLSTSFAVAAFSAGGALLGTSLGALAGWGIGSVATSNGLVPTLGAIGGGALGGLAGSATGGGLGALWLTPDER